MTEDKYYGKLGDKYIVCYMFDNEEDASDIGAFIHSLVMILGKVTE